MSNNEVVAQIAKDYKSEVSKSGKIQKLNQKRLAEKATYLDADAYSLELASILESSISRNVAVETLTAADYRAIMGAVLPQGLKGVSGSVSTFAQSVQSGLNAKNGLAFKAIATAFDAQGAQEIIRKAVNAERYIDIPGGLKADMMNFSQNVATRTMKENAELSNDLGFEVTVDRIYDDVGVHNRKDVCEWCLEREGHWTYAEALANGVFERHPGCGCQIIYNTATGSQRQTNWQNNQWENI